MKAVVVIILSLLTAAQGLGQNNALEKQAPKKYIKDAQGNKHQVVDFEESNIEGRIKLPSGFYIHSRRRAKTKRLIQLRSNFRDQVELTAPRGLITSPH